MSRGVGVPASGRRWGRAGVVLLACLSACGHQVMAAAPAGRSVGPASVRTTATAAAIPAEEAIPAAPAEFVGDPAPPAPPPAQLVSSPPVPASEGGVWAVIVGVDDYPGRAHDLRSAVNDAGDMDAALGRYGVAPEHRVRLTDGQGSAATITRGLDWLTAHAGPDATAVFFFAGHVRKLAPGTEALVGADGQLVRDVDLAAHLSGLRAGRTWLVIAGCYGGGFTEALKPGRILTAAAPADQLAYESSDLRRSYLVEYVVHEAMLEGRADASVESAFAWGVGALRREHPDRMPVQFDEVPGELSLGTAAPLPAPRQAPPPTPSTTTSTTRPPPSKGPPPEPNRSCILTVGSTVRCPND